MYELFSLLQLNFSFAPSIIISPYLTCSLLLFSITPSYLICSPLLFSFLYKPPSFLPPFLGNYSTQMFLIQWKQWLLSLIVPLPWVSLTIRWKIQVHHFFLFFVALILLSMLILSYLLPYLFPYLLTYLLTYLLSYLLIYLATSFLYLYPVSQ